MIKTALLILSCVIFTGCASTTDNKLGDYNTRRRIPINDEIPMESMNYYNPENIDNNAISDSGYELKSVELEQYDY